MQNPLRKKALLVCCNVIVIIGTLIAAAFYSRTITEQQNTMRIETFCNNVEALKQTSLNYLYTEKKYAANWTAYIEAKHMTAEEALEYIRTTNSQEDRSAHLIDMEDYSARSTYLRKDSPWVNFYREQKELDVAYSRNFLNRMQQMFDDESDRILVLGKYRVSESQRTVVAVGNRVMIRQEDGTDKPYLLLRLIPADYLQKAWVFPIEYKKAEIALINKEGGYVIQSPSLRNRSFLDFIRAYNYQDNYNEVKLLEEQLKTTEKGMLEYKDSKGQDCFFYYSDMGQNTGLDILGYIPVNQITVETLDWTIVILVSGALFILMLLDGAYILKINKRLRKAIQEGNKANQAKTQFLSSMSHDIRTPMNAVIGMTEIARSHLQDTQLVGECLDKVATSGKYLLTLVNDILDISKVESGNMTLNPIAFSVSSSVHSIEEMVRQSAEEKNIEVKIELKDITQDYVMGDTLRLQQVLLNLLTNAVKYTPDWGHVLFQAWEKKSNREGYVCLQFTIQDDGIGMSEEFQKTMYHSFSRAMDSRINTVQGSGLGLAIAKQMIDLMDGQIYCNSAPGKGTTFVVNLDLPKAPGKEGEQSQDSSEEGPETFAGMRVLVAEDNELNWEIIHMMLEEYEIIADRAANGQICIDMLKQNENYDMVLMDIQMPEMNGREATRFIRKSEEPYLRQMPIVAMTADAFAEDVYACMEAGMDWHISKPIEKKRVLEVLQKCKNHTLHKEIR